MRIVFTTPPGYGLMLPVVPLIWAARAAGHEVLVATTADMVDVAAQAGLPVIDVFPERNLWQDLMTAVMSRGRKVDHLPEEYRTAAQSGNPFGLFTMAMTEGTIEAARNFAADLIAYTSDHPAGALTALTLGIPALEVGNRISWSMRDQEFREGRELLNNDPVVDHLRDKLAIPEGLPQLVARIDPRAPSMGGITADQSDPRDGVPWWPMQYVPYNGGTAIPTWVFEKATRPLICVTLGTVVPAMNGISSLSVILNALGAMDVDVILAEGNADLSSLGQLPDNVRTVGYLPLSAFLAACSLIIHHGGSGTTATPLYYGVPQLVLPSFADNPMSAQRVADRGVGLSHDPATIDVPIIEGLVQRLLTEPDFQDNAQAVRAEIASQPSPASIIERLNTQQ